MTEKLANAIYDILMETMGANEYHRFTFVFRYLNTTAPTFPIHKHAFRTQQTGTYHRTETGLGYVTSADAESAAAAAQRLGDLERWLIGIPPTERLAWVSESASL